MVFLGFVVSFSVVNLGSAVLQSLFSYWKEGQPKKEVDDQESTTTTTSTTTSTSTTTTASTTTPQVPSPTYEMAEDVPIILYELGVGSATYQLDYKRRNQYTGTETNLPFWVTDLLIHVIYYCANFSLISQ